VTWERRVDDVAELLLWVATQRPATLGGTRLLCVDGPAGSGKTTLAEALARAAGPGSALVLHMDDLYEGWSGLGPELVARVDAGIVAPLRHGQAGAYRRYDWHRQGFAERHAVPPVDLLVLEGVGSGGAAYHDAVTLLVWVEAPRELRIQRGVARDGETVLPFWTAWMEDEDRHFATERTRERADVIVDGSGQGAASVTFC
jgi:uridine kinase